MLSFSSLLLLLFDENPPSTAAALIAGRDSPAFELEFRSFQLNWRLGVRIRLLGLGFWGGVRVLGRREIERVTDAIAIWTKPHLAGRVREVLRNRLVK